VQDGRLAHLLGAGEGPPRLAGRAHRPAGGHERRQRQRLDHNRGTADLWVTEAEIEITLETRGRAHVEEIVARQGRRGVRGMTGGPRRALAPRAVFARDGYRCVYCGLVLPPEQLSLDHVQPRLRGGDGVGGQPGHRLPPLQRPQGLRSPPGRGSPTLPEERANFLRYATAVWPRHRRAVEEAARLRSRSDPA
jgi:hypothetical protein